MQKINKNGTLSDSKSIALLWLLPPVLATTLLIHFTTTLGVDGVLDPELVGGSKISWTLPFTPFAAAELLKVSIVLLTLWHMILLIFFRPENLQRRSSDSLPKRITWFPVIVFSIIQLTFILAGFFFSDDSLRHIVDGYHLFQGKDVYSISARILGPVAGFFPNHPDSATIYLPVTQLQAILGAPVSERYGFIIIYHLILIACVLAIYRLLKSPERVYFLLVLFSPLFLITSSSRHADVQGLLLVLLMLVLLREGKRPLIHSEARRSVRMRQSLSLLSGLVAGFLPGLKPDGLIWLSAAFLFLMLDYGTQKEKSSGQRELSFPGDRWLFFSLGVLTSFLLQIAISLVFLFPSLESLKGFQRTGEAYLNLFFAYNPFVFWRMNGESGSPHLLIQDHRHDFIALGAALMAFKLLRAKTVGGSGGARASVPEGVYPYGQQILIILTATAVAARGAWHPWYFLWVLPALYLMGGLRITLILLNLLPLFYLAVVDLRFRGDWSYQETYSFLILFAGGWLLLTKYPQNTMLQIWGRIRSRFCGK